MYFHRSLHYFVYCPYHDCRTSPWSGQATMNSQLRHLQLLACHSRAALGLAIHAEPSPMSEFSIELAAEQIVDARTKSYFKEVLSSFINGHYRSAAVMLWSVVISDLVYKLQDLRDLYQDPVATSILEEVLVKQTAKPKNPEWEPYLLDEVNSRTQFFETGEHQHILWIHSLRHLSAHPILSSSHLLYEPNKETARAAIRNALECVLLKPPVFSRKVVINLIEDLGSRKALLPDAESLRMYLEAKYLKNLHPTVKLELVRALWKFCFRLSNPDLIRYQAPQPSGGARALRCNCRWPGGSYPSSLPG